MDVEVAVIGGGVVGCAAALALARRGAEVVLLEAEEALGGAASGTNSGVLHTGFDSVPGELETEMILRAAELRGAVIEALGVPFACCGAEMRPVAAGDRERIAGLAQNAQRNGVEAELRDDGVLDVPGEAITDPRAFTGALAAAAERHGAVVRLGSKVEAIAGAEKGLRLGIAGGEEMGSAVAVNCAGLHADEVAALAGDNSFGVYPRKGEFLVFDGGGAGPLERILLPVPSAETKGILVFPTLDGQVIAGPTAVDGDDKGDWSVRPQARAEVMSKASAMHPPLERLEPVAAYAGLRPAGRDGRNYLIARSDECSALVNVAAIRSTGLTASLGIAERCCALVAEAGVALAEEEALRPGSARVEEPWWQVAAARG